MKRLEKIQRFLKVAQMMGYLTGTGREDYKEMSGAIEGRLTFAKLTDAFNRLFLKPNFVPVCEKDREDFEGYFKINREDFEQDFYEVEGYHYAE